jgi:hypothetical protein
MAVHWVVYLAAAKVVCAVDCSADTMVWSMAVRLEMSAVAVSDATRDVNRAVPKVEWLAGMTVGMLDTIAADMTDDLTAVAMVSRMAGSMV